MSAVDPAEQQLATAHRALLHAKGLQLDFAKAPPPPKIPAWMEWLGRVLRDAGPVLRFIFWGGLVVAGVVIVWLVVREMVRLRRGDHPAATGANWRPDEAAARALLQDADQLAAQGRYDEAVHTLLFRSIDDLAGRRPGVVRPALTSRDIAALSVLPEGPRTAFARIAEAVERSFFGGRPLGEAEFDAARRDYEAYALAGGWA